MEKKILFDKYLEIEKELYPIKDFLEENKHIDEYQTLYKGFITMQSPLLFNPEILFLGINPGQGAFNENKNLGIDETIRIFEPDKQVRLDWYKKGNARCQKKNGKWVKGYEWFERNQGINNQFVANMIELLYEVAKLKFPDENVVPNTLPSWFETFGQNIMFTNLYPVATKDTEDLNKIFRYFSKEEEIFTHFGFSKPVKKWDIQRGFIRNIEKTVKLVEPKVIVCMGTQAFNDFTYTTTKKNKKVFTGKKGDFPVIGFNRSGNWSNLITDIATAIFDNMK